MTKQTQEANSFSISQLEDEMDALDIDSDDYQEKVERICNRIAELEDADSIDAESDKLQERARDALHFFGVPESTFLVPTAKLSGGDPEKGGPRLCFNCKAISVAPR